MRLSFCCDAFGIERIVREKMVSLSFGEATGPGMRTLDVWAALPMR